MTADKHEIYFYFYYRRALLAARSVVNEFFYSKPVCRPRSVLLLGFNIKTFSRIFGRTPDFKRRWFFLADS